MLKDVGIFVKQLLFLAVVMLLTMSFGFAADEVLAVPGQSVFEMIAGFLSSAEGASVAIAIGLELVLRVVPSKKPLGILLAVASICEMAGSLLSRLGKFLHNVLPQNVVK